MDKNLIKPIIYKQDQLPEPDNNVSGCADNFEGRALE